MKILTLAVIARINMSLQHWDTPLTLVKKPVILLQDLQIEASTNQCPLKIEHHLFGPLIIPDLR